MQQTCDVRHCLAYASFYWERGDGSRTFRCQEHQLFEAPAAATKHEWHLTPGGEDVPAHRYVPPGHVADDPKTDPLATDGG